MTAAVTTRDCLRNALRRTGRALPPAAADIAAPLTDAELSALVCRLVNILCARSGAA